MALTPRYKVYSADHDYLASTKSIECAAYIVANLGPGATIRNGHARADIIWTEGHDGYAMDDINFVLALGSQRLARL